MKTYHPPLPEFDGRAEPVGAGIEEFPEYWDTEDLSDWHGHLDADDARVPPSQSWWTEPRWDVGSTGQFELLYLGQLLCRWLTHEPRPSDVDRIPLECDVYYSEPGHGQSGKRRAHPLTVGQLAGALGITDPDQVAVVRRLVARAEYDEAMQLSWYSP